MPTLVVRIGSETPLEISSTMNPSNVPPPLRRMAIRAVAVLAGGSEAGGAQGIGEHPSELPASEPAARIV
jgi:hypothetical protein